MSDPHSSFPQRRQAMTEALRAWDPEAEVMVEPATGRLMVMTTLSTDKVVAILREAGEQVEPGEPQERKPGQCCGGCSH